MMRRGVLRVVWLAMAVLGISVGEAAAAGGVGALFDLGVSASSLGVGGARAAFRDDTAAAALNPAGLAWVDGVGIESLYVSQFGGVAYGAVAFAAPYLGVAASLVDSGWIPSGDSGFRFAAQGIAAAGAVPLGPVALGTRCRFVRVGAPFGGHGVALDAALLVELGTVRVGAICDAIASLPMVYDGDLREAWRAELSFGAALTLTPMDEVVWTITTDVDGILRGPWRAIGGLEVWIGPAAARLGWDGGGPTFGLSLRIAGVELDWACAARSDLGASHRLSLEVLF